MAHSLSAKKRIRQNIKARERNKARRSQLRTSLRKCRDALLHREAQAAETAFQQACRLLDRNADRGLIHRNAAARQKSRLARRLNAIKSEASG
ncbi:MAG: 30S ribosomal protein S20 [Planctomycetota bacterium]|nr:MAG: 30S ribosomal protein S20 [Planctomycetota bacterium]